MVKAVHLREMDWVIGLSIFALVILTVPSLWRFLRATGSGGGGFAAGLGLMMMSVLDRPARAAIEEIEKRKEHGEERQGRIGGEPD